MNSGVEQMPIHYLEVVFNQEFLASYAVDIDETGVARLQKILDDNRDKAKQVADAFSGADTAISRLFSSGFTSLAENLRSLFFGASSGEPASASRGTSASSQAAGTASAAPSGTALSSNLFSEGMKNLSDMKTSLQTYLTTTGTTAAGTDRNETGRRTGEIASYLSSISAAVSRIAGGATGGEGSGGGGPSSGSGLTTGGSIGSASMAVNLDLTWANAAISAFMANASSRFRLTADASGVVSAASSALDRIRSMFSSTTLNVKTKVGTDTDASKSGTNIRLPQSTGGRFSTPTDVQVAEDGDPEYIIPFKKEAIAVPLLKNLLSELSSQARESILGASSRNPTASASTSRPSAADLSNLPGAPLSAHATSIPNLSALSLSLTDALSAPTASALSVSQTTNNTVDAPVTINVTATGFDPESLGRSVYDIAQRYQLRTLKGVFS